MATDDLIKAKPPVSVAVTQKNTGTIRVPKASGAKGTQTITTTKTSTRRIPINYEDPASEAANEFANTPEGPALAAKQKRLYEAGFYDSNDVIFYGRRSASDSKALGRAMDEANARGETWQAASDFRTSMNYAGLSQAQAAGTTGGGGGGGRSVSPAGSLQITGPKNARATFDALTRKYTGNKALDAEFKDAYSKLVKAQTAAPIKYGTQKIKGKYYTVQISDGVQADQFFEEYLFNKINFGSDEIGGAIGEGLSTIKELSRQYDMSLTTAERGQFAKGLLDGSMTSIDIKKTLAERAKSKYKVLADRINENVSVFDLASDYISAKANTLELDADALTVSDVSEAFSGDKLMNISEFITTQKKDPRYQYTGQARNDAASFATNLAAVFRTGA
jgi:hypothetical protein